ncbi:MAG: citrate (Si)-synthase [Desulfosarcina sp.]|nr:citrate (Si)-synthase [Desulfobacterales bacterium]
MEACTPTLNTGLRGVTVASTKISDVKGAEGKLIYRGFLVKDLAENATYEEIVHLLLYEHLPGDQELEAFKASLAEARAIPEAVLQILKMCPTDSHPMDILQAATSLLASYDPDLTERDRETSLRKAIRLIAKFPTIMAAWDRIRNGKEPVAPLSAISHAANFLYMLTGEQPDEELTRFFDASLVLHAEHSLNASTFSARQVASTRAHMYSAVTAALGSLSGELHGGANVRVMQMLQKIGSVDNVETYVQQELDAGRLIFGLGHAVYQTDDPRAHILAPMSKKMGARIGEPHWYEISRVLEKTGKAVFKAKKGIDIYVNVDFYSASLYYAMGIPIDLFTPLFALSRVAGWTAHVIEEQYADAAPKPALYRPASNYVGDYCGPEECSFVPLDDR